MGSIFSKKKIRKRTGRHNYGSYHGGGGHYYGDGGYSGGSYGGGCDGGGYGGGGGGSVGIRGCMAYEGEGVDFCSITPGEYVYIDTLENNLIPSAQLLIDADEELIFQQDCAYCT
ncbi:hypothetical protein BpHYR1_036606 [Brachionus plicatilis]|uniref:Uncharacterized protein n=1 Tax=Brachionus plicatilis TaxID=10195 RepID=A0A3M7T3I8_BRAPC|nr:hypothetical protein BpHYR1_036606 [Brachionus plicatilis]